MALGLEAISRGFGAYFINAHDLIADLEKAQRENRLERRMKVYISPRLLISYILEYGEEAGLKEAVESFRFGPFGGPPTPDSAKTRDSKADDD